MSTIIDSHLANANMKLFSDALSYIGLNPPILKNFLDSGACGLMPTIAGIEDLSHFFDRIEKTIKNPSFRDKLILASLSTEVAFDFFELSSSIAQVFQLNELQSLTESVSGYAMGIRIAGGIILAISSIDEARAIHGLRSFFGAKLKSHDTREKVKSTLRATEVASAAISNASLLAGGEFNKVYKIASLVTNVCKGSGFLVSRFFSSSEEEKNLETTPL